MHADPILLMQPEPLIISKERLEPSPQSQTAAFSLWLDCFRWVAALAVLFTHVNARFLTGISSASSTQRTLPLWLFALAASFGHQAVIIFFVLSGYLVGGGLWREVKTNKTADIKKYLFNRLSRLCTVLYPALVLIALLNILGVVVFHGIATGVYPADTFFTMRPAAFTCNAVFMQTALCSPYGHDVALWSLFNELWYYLVWPLFLLGFIADSRGKRASLLVLAFTILIILTILGAGDSPVGPYMTVWLLGAAVAWRPRPIIRSHAYSSTLLVATALGERVLAMHSPHGHLHTIGRFFLDLLIGALFSNLLISLKNDKNLLPPWGKNWNTRLAGFSFSLYCIHIPILDAYNAAIKYFLGGRRATEPDQPWKWVVVLGAVSLSVTGAFLFSRLTEANTGHVRCFLRRLVPSLR